jgi:hypothetical protein
VRPPRVCKYLQHWLVDLQAMAECGGKDTNFSNNRLHIACGRNAATLLPKIGGNMQSYGKRAVLVAGLSLTTLLAACGGSSPADKSTAAAAPASSQQGTTPEQREANYLHPRLGPPLGRPLDADEKRILSIDDPKVRVREALKAHKLTIAENDVYGQWDQGGDPDWQALRAQVAAAEQTDINSAGGTDFPAKVATNWLPQIRQVGLANPQTVDDIWQRENFFEVMAANLDGDRQDGDGGKSDTPAMASAGRKLRAAIAAQQARDFPILRRAFVKLSAAKMWEDDVEVRLSGRGIVYTGAIFATNANIQTAEDVAANDLKKLRFKTAEYEWCRGCRSWRYDLQSPSDTAVGSWPSVEPNATFEPVK